MCPNQIYLCIIETSFVLVFTVSSKEISYMIFHTYSYFSTILYPMEICMNNVNWGQTKTNIKLLTLYTSVQIKELKEKESLLSAYR